MFNKLLEVFGEVSPDRNCRLLMMFKYFNLCSYEVSVVNYCVGPPIQLNSSSFVVAVKHIFTLCRTFRCFRSSLCIIAQSSIR